VPFTFVKRTPTQGHALIQGDIIANFCRLANDHTGAMVNEKSASDNRTRVNFDTGKPTRNVTHKTRWPSDFSNPQSVVEAVKHNGVYT
jgi:hypothetical protein